ncbi:hypothetical protein SANA_27290 [Gottschalkiaceae bacterium SANA]|nr:hypothetical protein SANA_27290 [Gottschalkiaceae bacterium SANA]
METLESLIRLFRCATRIPVHWIYKNKILLAEEPNQHDPMKEIHRKIILSFPQNSSEYDKPIHRTSELNEAYFSLPANGGLLVFGPMLLHRPTEEKIRLRLKGSNLPYGQLPTLRQYDYELAVTGDMQRYYYGFLAWNIFRKELLSFQTTIETRPQDFPQPVLSEYPASDHVEQYVLEEKLMKAIRHGQPEVVKQALFHYQQPNFDGAHPTMKLLRAEKNRLIATATLAARSAIQGGLTEEKALHLKDVYIQQSEKEQSFDQVRTLHLTLVIDFANQVNQKQTGTYSSLILRATHLIEENKTRNYLLSELASELNLHPSYLSRLLKEETGMSFKRYLTHVRMETAKQMLQNPINSILEISLFLGYGGQSHFTQVFRTETGLTPLQFRKQLLLHRKK